MIQDFNCDLGEGEPLARTRMLMRWIGSANVACGGHAGDAATMERCVQLAGGNGVRLGAHPGPWSRADFGRGAVRLTPRELEALLLQQIGSLEVIARAAGVALHHIKLHGALYHAVEQSESMARSYLAIVRRWWPRCVLYVRAGGWVERLGRVSPSRPPRLWAEVFADRAYREDGLLVPRDRPDALLRTAAEVRRQVRELHLKGGVTTVEGRWIPLRGRTLCLHSDSGQAGARARLVAGLL